MTGRPTRPPKRRSMIGVALPQFPGFKAIPRSRRTGGHMIRRHPGEVFHPTRTPFTHRREVNRRRNKVAKQSRKRNRPNR